MKKVIKQLKALKKEVEKLPKHRHRWEPHQCGCNFCEAPDYECSCGETKWDD